MVSRHSPVPLADVGVECELPGALLHRPVRGQSVRDGDDHPPLGEAAAQLAVLLAPRVQRVQALGEHLARAARQRHPALVHRDARQDALELHNVVREGAADKCSIVRREFITNGPV